MPRSTSVTCCGTSVEAHPVLAPAFGGAQHGRLVAVGEVGEAADRDHDVEERHPLPVRQGLRARRLAHDSDLLAVGAVELRDQDRHHRIADEPAHRFLDVARELGRSLADGVQVLDQRDADLAIRAHRHGRRQVWVAPDSDLQGVERADQVAVIGRGSGGLFGGGRIAAASPEEAAQASSDTKQAYVGTHGDRS
jgi:hypothetical protein